MYKVKFFNPKLNPTQIKYLNELTHFDCQTNGPMVKNAEDTLSNTFNHPVMMTSSGSSALFLLFYLKNMKLPSFKRFHIEVPNRVCPSVIRAAELANVVVNHRGKMIDGDWYSIDDSYSVYYNGLLLGPLKDANGILDACQISWRVIGDSKAWATVVSFSPTKMMRGIGGGAIIGPAVDEIKNAELMERFDSFCAPNEYQGAAVYGLHFDVIDDWIEERAMICELYHRLFCSQGVGQGGSLWYEIPYNKLTYNELLNSEIEISEFYSNNSERTIALPVDISLSDMSYIYGRL